MMLASYRGTQVCYYGTHQVLLTDDALYILVWNAAKLERQADADREKVSRTGKGSHLKHVISQRA